VQVSSSEGLANHTVPESCVGLREGVGEALTGVRIGWVLSRENATPGTPRNVDFISIVAVALIVLALVGVAWIHFGR
jgi:hypothetical protein